MTIKLKVKRYNLRRPDPVSAPVSPPPRPRALPASSVPPRAASASAPATDDGFGADPFPTAGDQVSAMMDAGADRPAPPRSAPAQPGAAQASAPNPNDIDQIRKEGLTGRQLRMARRMAQKYGLPATSDFDAVRLLRAAGIDPFQKSTFMEMISAEGADSPLPGGEAASRALTVAPRGDGVHLPQTIKPIKVPSTELRAEESHLSEIQRIQRDLARRRRRKSALLMARLFFFVGLPTLLAGWYYYVVATPLFATKAEFVIQQADPAGAQGMGGLLSGTQFATSQDSIAVQGYLQSRDAMMRLDADHKFSAHFAQEQIDPLQRLDVDATREAAYKVYQRNVKIAYDPTEGIIKMEVIAADPGVSADFSQALIGYAEEQVDHLTQRLRADQMKGAFEAYELAEAAMLTAQRKVVDLQEQFQVLSSEVEVTLITTQIGQLETQLSQDRLSLAQMQSNSTPNAARMAPLIRRIATLEAEIATLRSRLTQGVAGGNSLAQVQSELLVAQADVQTRQLLLSQSLQSMETARTDANRQVRYLSVSVSPVPPDEATYPRAFENTMVALLIFAGIYLMISMTAAILREQVSA
ncbi:capsule biosynthesis protein [Pseudotabrizicola sediminis]|uniref:Capsule biosynthesis protein n=1 Tax=Pseudotabrizicola sediminis TaxID=2486418 RepID=A0ABY2KUY6_9RHOB|nr:capsule biosynthesis protein [Pseudotabrizicola sediminis]TGD45092.1 capsule biosynthesis protein [Pseudotabrizicola sediminis]TGD61362.1 capsule biosynthesis protein [Tabrizicola sp. WMC-M-20]